MSDISLFYAYMNASIEAQLKYAHKKAMEESEGDIEKYFIAFDYHYKDLVKRIDEQMSCISVTPSEFACIKNQLVSSQPKGGNL